MKYIALMVFLAAIIFLLPPGPYAHGVRGNVGTGAVVVSAEYDTGEPMSYARVKISAPGARVGFQSGRTDRNGRFCFSPDTPGDWMVVVDDEIGHRLEVVVPVNKAKKIITDQQTDGADKGYLSRYEGAIMGVSIIFWIFGIFFWWKGKKIYKKIVTTQVHGSGVHGSRLESDED